MMVKSKGVKVAVSTIYYWIDRGHLGKAEDFLLYPRKKSSKRQRAFS
ncbi:hypothetical protein SORDD16_01570 [Streptococcus oralis]|uniref:Uncharacterized protein n=1 Tax=Streptococcus oralis TaxID=1303 RepID=A0A139PA62_STROR|nr:hypothetical protein SORDD16_01570 [Streptococcus oralis]